MMRGQSVELPLTSSYAKQKRYNEQYKRYLSSQILQKDVVSGNPGRVRIGAQKQGVHCV